MQSTKHKASRRTTFRRSECHRNLPSYLQKKIPEKICCPEQDSDASGSGALGYRELQNFFFFSHIQNLSHAFKCFNVFIFLPTSICCKIFIIFIFFLIIYEILILSYSFPMVLFWKFPSVGAGDGPANWETTWRTDSPHTSTFHAGRAA